MSFYENLRDGTANTLITKYGRSFTFTRVTKGTYDPAIGSTTGDTSATFTSYAVKADFSAYERNDSSIQIDDVRLIALASGGFLVDDFVTIEGEEYRLIKVDPIKPAAVVVAYKLQARK